VTVSTLPTDESQLSIFTGAFDEPTSCSDPPRAMIETNPFEVGLDWVGTFDDDADFLGRTALQHIEKAGVERFVFFSVLGASIHHRARFFRAKALAERAAVRNEPYRWPHQRERYLSVVHHLIHGPAGVSQHERAARG